MSRSIATRAERRTLSQAVTEAMLDRIRAGELRPGDRLPTEKGLMEQYGVGRNAAREAVQALVAMGLVEVRPGRGATLLAIDASPMDDRTIAALLSDEMIENLYDFRRLIEVEAAARAAEHATDEEIAEIASALAHWRRDAEHADETPLPTDDEFHAAIARASHNPLFVTMLGTVTDLIRRGRQLATHHAPWAVERARVEHDEILAAISAHDSALAAQCMRVHLDGAIEAVRAGREAGTHA